MSEQRLYNRAARRHTAKIRAACAARGHDPAYVKTLDGIAWCTQCHLPVDPPHKEPR